MSPHRALDWSQSAEGEEITQWFHADIRVQEHVQAQPGDQFPRARQVERQVDVFGHRGKCAPQRGGLRRSDRDEHHVDGALGGEPVNQRRKPRGDGMVEKMARQETHAPPRGHAVLGRAVRRHIAQRRAGLLVELRQQALQVPVVLPMVGQQEVRLSHFREGILQPDAALDQARHRLPQVAAYPGDLVPRAGHDRDRYRALDQRGIVRIEREDQVVAGACVLEAPQVPVELRQVAVGQHVPGIGARRLAVAGDGLVESARFAQRVAQVDMRLRMRRVERDRGLEALEGFRLGPEPAQHHAQVVARVDVSGIESDRLPVAPGGVLHAPRQAQGIAKLLVQFGIPGIEGRRPGEQRDGFVQAAIPHRREARVAQRSAGRAAPRHAGEDASHEITQHGRRPLRPPQAIARSSQRRLPGKPGAPTRAGRAIARYPTRCAARPRHAARHD